MVIGLGIYGLFCLLCGAMFTHFIHDTSTLLEISRYIKEKRGIK